MSNPPEMAHEAALEMAETEERMSHGQPTFFVAGDVADRIAASWKLAAKRRLLEAGGR